jgi:hypothetical protein
VIQKSGLAPQETPFFTQTDPIPELGAVRAFNQEAFTLKPKEVGVAECPRDMPSCRPWSFQPARSPPFEEARDKVRQAVSPATGPKIGGARGRAIIAAPAPGGAPDQGGGPGGPAPQGQRLFYAGPGFPAATPGRTPDQRCFHACPSNNPYPDQPIFWQGNYYLLALKNRKLPTDGGVPEGAGRPESAGFWKRNAGSSWRPGSRKSGSEPKSEKRL